jgi:hypothetical protein
VTPTCPELISTSPWDAKNPFAGCGAQKLVEKAAGLRNPSSKKGSIGAEKMSKNTRSHRPLLAENSAAVVGKIW